MTDEQTAAAIIGEAATDLDPSAKSWMRKLRAAIVRALQQARQAPAGHIIDDQGVVRRIYCKTARYGFWIHEEDETKPVDVMQQPYLGPTREAAEAAKEAKKCYPFSTETCQRPECKCREEKEASK